MNVIFNTLDKNYIKYGKKKIYVIIDHHNQLWFSGKDTAISLGYKDNKDAIKKHVDIEDMIRYKELKKIISSDKIISGHPDTVFINEAGLYSLVLRSKLGQAKKFKYWVTHDVLPAIRKYGTYKLKQSYERERIDLINKLNYFIEENKLIKNDMKKKCFPDGAVVYFVDYSTKYESIFRLGMTSDMKKRKQLYNTHTLHNREVVIIKETKYPIRLETCMRAMLYDYRYNDKDFFYCELSVIKKAFNNCIRSINLINNMKGGSKTNHTKINSVDIISIKINSFRQRKNILDKKIHRLNKKLVT